MPATLPRTLHALAVEGFTVTIPRSAVSGARTASCRSQGAARELICERRGFALLITNGRSRRGDAVRRTQQIGSGGIASDDSIELPPPWTRFNNPIISAAAHRT